MKTDVILVATPFLSLQRPALGASLLKAALADRDVGCEIRYLNLAYAAFEGADFCQHVAERTRPHHLLGEWIFSHLIQGTAGARPLDHGIDWIRAKAEATLIDSLIAARARAADFVDVEARQLLDARPAIVGFSSSFQQNCASLALAARIKELSPETLVCFGGANAEGAMGRSLLATFEQIDLVFSGESDISFPEFVAGYLASKRGPVGSRPRDERFIQGVPVTEMDALPHPDYGDYFAELSRAPFANRILATLPFESSRGCWWGAKHHCTFCGLNGQGMGFRSKSADRVVEEVVQLRDTWQVRRFSAADNIMDMRHVESVFAAHSDEFSDCRFFYEIKANLTTDQLATLHAAGVRWVQPGIESLNDEILRLMDKGVRALQNVLLLRTAREIGTRVSWNILGGFPGERPEQYVELAELMPKLQHLEPPIGIGQIRIDRFSPYHTDPEKRGFGPLRPAPAYRHVYDLDDEVLANLAYHFEADRADGLELANYVEPVIAPLLQWIERFRTGRPASLAFRQLGPLVMVEDTRDMAIEPMRTLPGDERDLLAAFERPARIDTTLERLTAAWPHTRTPEACFAAVEALGYLVRHGGMAVHVITEPARRISGQGFEENSPNGLLLSLDAVAAE